MAQGEADGTGGLPSLAALEGVWDLSRVIRHGDGREDRFQGQAAFRREGEGLTLVEAGQLTVGGQAFEAEQMTIWTENDGQVAVFFADQRPFHSFPFHVPAPEAVHHCAPDLYEVAYDFSAFPRWQAVWRVTGPRKDYRMRSTYARAAP